MNERISSLCLAQSCRNVSFGHSFDFMSARVCSVVHDGHTYTITFPSKDSANESESIMCVRFENLRHQMIPRKNTHKNEDNDYRRQRKAHQND